MVPFRAEASRDTGIHRGFLSHSWGVAKRGSSVSLAHLTVIWFSGIMTLFRSPGRAEIRVEPSNLDPAIVYIAGLFSFLGYLMSEVKVE